jgi:hypothetical protein
VAPRRLNAYKLISLQWPDRVRLRSLRVRFGGWCFGEGKALPKLFPITPCLKSSSRDRAGLRSFY